MGDVIQIHDEAVKRLKQESLVPTPNNYAKMYCKTAKDMGLSPVECRKFKEFVQKLPKSDQEYIKNKNLETFEDVMLLILRRVDTNNLKKVTSLLHKSLQPSILKFTDKEVLQLCEDIIDSPELVFQPDIQDKIDNIISKRIGLDKEELNKRTKEISALMGFLSKYMKEAISINEQSGGDIAKIANEISELDDIDETTLKEFQDKLVNAANNIQDAVKQTTQKLETGSDYVKALQNRIKKLEEKLEVAERENYTDGLTQVLNRKAFEIEVEKYEEMYKRNNMEYAISFFDIDFFKKVNDTYGHDAGDVVLKTFAQLLKKSLRKTDIIARYGGEEFVVLSIIKDEAHLPLFLGRLKKIVNENKFIYKEHKLKVTFSSGVVMRSKYNSFEDAIKKSDDLLYEAKRNGRNQIRFDNGEVI